MTLTYTAAAIAKPADQEPPDAACSLPLLQAHAATFSPAKLHDASHWRFQ
jgi:hypothetical protein